MKEERSDAIDRGKERAIAFGDWIHDFYVAVNDYNWISIYRPRKPMTTGELYDRFMEIGKL